MLIVPTIDVSGLPGDRKATGAIAAACEDWGFFQIVGHGIGRERCDEFLSQARAFFKSPAEIKQSVLRDHANPMGFYDRELTKNTPDWKEVFDYGIELRDPASEMPSRWPTGMDTFRETMLAWYDACETVSFLLLDAISDAIEEPRETLTRAFSPYHTSFVRLNYYPVCADPAPSASGSVIEQGHLGVNRHTDAGALTVLVQDEVPALQVNRDGRWYTIEPDPDGLIINAGDMLQVWSNDRFKAAEHRVIAYADKERFSAPFFFNPAFDVNCFPLGVAENDAHYHPVNWGHFRTERANGDFADYGEEIQISRFRKDDATQPVVSPR